MREAQHSSDVLRNELIGPTLRSARDKSRFFRTHFSGIDLDTIATVNDLPKLPVLRKADVRRAGFAMLCDEQTPSHVQNTSGSTGEPLLLFRSQEEVRFIRAFFSNVVGTESVQGNQPIVLTLTIPHHGTPTPIPGRAFVLHGSVSDDELLEQTVVLLGKGFHLSGVEEHVSIIAGSVSQVLLLTSYILETGSHFLAQHIRAIEITGDYLTPRWREVLSAVWGARINDRYSLSEIFGGASFCQKCGAYHFDAHVVAEVVNVGGTRHADDGVVGELLLTSLSPFVQLQPFIRYATGDLFTRTDRGCWELSYEFRGRTSHALFDPRGVGDTLLIDGRTILDALDIPSAARSVRYRDLTTIRDKSAAGRPIYEGRMEIKDNELDISLAVELGVTPGLFPAPAAMLRDEIATEIICRSIGLRCGIARRDTRFNVETVSPGSLNYVIKRSKVWLFADARP